MGVVTFFNFHFSIGIFQSPEGDLVQRGVDIRSVQLLLGHESLETTMIYTHVARKGPAGVTSPLDLLEELKPEEVEAAVAATRGLHLPPREAAAEGKIGNK
jgi:hypothetical protein